METHIEVCVVLWRVFTSCRVGVRRATIAPRSQLEKSTLKYVLRVFTSCFLRATHTCPWWCLRHFARPGFPGGTTFLWFCFWGQSNPMHPCWHLGCSSPLMWPAGLVGGWVCQDRFFGLWRYVCCQSCFFKGFSSVRNGDRILLMSVRESIPSSLNVLSFQLRTWYSGQPVKFSVCRESGHFLRACPLSGLWRRCKEPGHVARKCVRPWGQSRPPSPVPVSLPPNSAPVPGLFPISDVFAPLDSAAVPDPEDIEDLSSVSSDCPALSAPDPVSDVSSYPSITFEDLPRRPRVKHVKRLSAPTTAFPFSDPKISVIPKSASVLGAGFDSLASLACWCTPLRTSCFLFGMSGG